MTRSAPNPQEPESNQLRIIQAILILPAIGLVWIPGGFFFYLVFFILIAALLIEIAIQSRAQS
jgi:hypothetical protein